MGSNYETNYQGRTVLITGGAGFIGVNAAETFIQDGWRAIVFDNLSRQGSSLNAAYLEKRYGDDCEFILGDIRSDHAALAQAVSRASVVLHLAAQVAVTTSLLRPLEDMETNICGTVNVLEAIRASSNRPLLIYSSTNKVYGSMEEVPVVKEHTRYRFRDLARGVDEDRPLDFHSPYGCSKGAADQYVRDYHRCYGLPTVVFRQSCIYGPRQFGVEDQGWVAWFCIAALMDRPITVYGDGLQVRDLLHVDDLVSAYQEAARRPSRVAGQIYNIGGGPENTLSVRELLRILEDRTGRKLAVEYAEWRTGDQPVFVADIRKARRELQWRPALRPAAGIDGLLAWIELNREEIERVLGPAAPAVRPLVRAAGSAEPALPAELDA